MHLLVRVSRPARSLRAFVVGAINLWLLGARALFSFLVYVLPASLYRALMRDLYLEAVPSSELSLPLLAARLTDLPYQVDTEAEISAGVDSCICKTAPSV